MRSAFKNEKTKVTYDPEIKAYNEEQEQEYNEETQEWNKKNKIYQNQKKIDQLAVEAKEIRDGMDNDYRQHELGRGGFITIEEAKKLYPEKFNEDGTVITIKQHEEEGKKPFEDGIYLNDDSYLSGENEDGTNKYSPVPDGQIHVVNNDYNKLVSTMEHNQKENIENEREWQSITNKLDDAGVLIQENRNLGESRSKIDVFDTDLHKDFDPGEKPTEPLYQVDIGTQELKNIDMSDDSTETIEYEGPEYFDMPGDGRNRQLYVRKDVADKVYGNTDEYFKTTGDGAYVIIDYKERSKLQKFGDSIGYAVEDLFDGSSKPKPKYHKNLVTGGTNVIM
jgi:hypothetical protein